MRGFKGQLTFEYLVLLGGVLIMAVFIIGLLYTAIHGINTCSQIETFKTQVQNGTVLLAIVEPNPCNPVPSDTVFGRLIHNQTLETYAKSDYSIALCVYDLEKNIMKCSNPSTDFLKCIAIGDKSSCNKTPNLNPGLNNRNLTVTANGKDKVTWDFKNAAGRYKLWFEIYDARGDYKGKSAETTIEVTKK